MLHSGMKKRKIAFHGTNEKSLEKILDSGMIMPSGGRYGNGVYCRSSLSRTFNDYQCFLGIRLRGLEDIAAVPGNKKGKELPGKWVVFTEEVPLDFISVAVHSYQVGEDEPNQIKYYDMDGIRFYDVPYLNEFDKHNKMLDVSNDINKLIQDVPFPRYDQIRICGNYSLEPSLDDGSINWITQKNKNHNYKNLL